MNIDTRTYANNTSLTVRYPWGFNIAASAMCPDGVVRRVSRIATTADTFFSIPAAVSVRYQARRYTVAGYVTIASPDGLDCSSDPSQVEFHPYAYGKNGMLFTAMNERIHFNPSFWTDIDPGVRYQYMLTRRPHSAANHQRFSIFCRQPNHDTVRPDKYTPSLMEYSNG